MAREPSRRRLLRASGVAAALGLAGCSGRNPREFAERVLDGSSGTPGPDGDDSRTPDGDPPSDGDAEADDSPAEVVAEFREPTGRLSDVPIPSDATDRRYPTMGRDDAPLTVTCYGGLKCSHTHRFVREFLGDLVAEFVRPGRLRIEFQFVPARDGEPFHGADELSLTRGAYAVWRDDPARFFAFFAYNYENFERSDGWWTADRIVALAEAADADSPDRIRAAVESEAFADRIDDTMDRVRSIPVRSIPRLRVPPEATDADDGDGSLLAPNPDPEGTRRRLAAAVERASGDG